MPSPALSTSAPLEASNTAMTRIPRATLSIEVQTRPSAYTGLALPGRAGDSLSRQVSKTKEGFDESKNQSGVCGVIRPGGGASGAGIGGDQGEERSESGWQEGRHRAGQRPQVDRTRPQRCSGSQGR